MLTTYKVNTAGCIDGTPTESINLIDLTPGTPAAARAINVTASGTAAPNTVQNVNYLTTTPVVLTFSPGVAVDDRIMVVIRDINSVFTIKDGATGPILLEKTPPLNEHLIQTFRWTGTAWIPAN